MLLLAKFFSGLLTNATYLDIFPQELVLPLSMHAVTALFIALFVVMQPWVKTITGRLFATLLLISMVMGYDTNLMAIAGVLRGVLPGITDQEPVAVVSAAYLLSLAAIAVLAGFLFEKYIKKIRRVSSRDLTLGMLVLVAYLFFMPTVGIVSKLPTIARQSRTQAKEFTNNVDKGSAERPDIYYIVLDRYTNSSVLGAQFNFDNSTFTDFLKDNNFVVNENAYSNYPFTNMSVASTINGQYTNGYVAQDKFNDVQSSTLYYNLIWQNSVTKSLKAEGYKYYGIGNWYGTSYKHPLADVDYTWQHKMSVFGKSKTLRGIEASEFEKSPYYRFFQGSGTAAWWPLKYDIKDHSTEVKEQISILKDLSTSKESGGRFIFAHILLPHDPYIFNSDGSLSVYTAPDNVGKPIKEKYTNQIEFINSQMKEIVENINKQSNGSAVIVINADEGPYPWSLNTTAINPTIYPENDMRKWSDDWLKMKFGILQAVHIPRANEEDMANISSANIFRIILNRYANTDLEYLPYCQFGIIDSNTERYVYADITNRFGGVEQKQCEEFQSVP
jgi:hypothetical protein